MLKKESFVESENEILNYSSKKFEPFIRLLPNFENVNNISNEMIDEFLLELYRSKVLINFDWLEWEKGNEIIENDDYDYSSLDIIDICKLLTAIVQVERCIDGGIRDFFEDGTLIKILYQLKIKVNL